MATKLRYGPCSAKRLAVRPPPPPGASQPGGARGWTFRGRSTAVKLTNKRPSAGRGFRWGQSSVPSPNRSSYGAARKANEAGFDALIACAFNYEAHATEFTKVGVLPVLKACMTADLQMADDLANTEKGNLFVVFGEPNVEIGAADGEDAETGRIQVTINGVDVFQPNSGEVRSDNADGIACWFVDTDYNDESYFVRQAYFLGANDPYKALKTTLKAEIEDAAWATLRSDTSRPFERPKSGRIAVKVINHLGDEVMKVFQV